MANRSLMVDGSIGSTILGHVWPSINNHSPSLKTIPSIFSIINRQRIHHKPSSINFQHHQPSLIDLTSVDHQLTTDSPSPAVNLSSTLNPSRVHTGTSVPQRTTSLRPGHAAVAVTTRSWPWATSDEQGRVMVNKWFMDGQSTVKLLDSSWWSIN